MNNKEAIKYLIAPIATSTQPSTEYLKQKEAYDLAIKVLERPKGKWVLIHPIQENDEGAYMCSVCQSGDWHISPEFEFCPYCGADMRKGSTV